MAPSDWIVSSVVEVATVVSIKGSILEFTWID